MPRELPVSYEERDNYLFWDMTPWKGDFEILADIENRWKEVTSEAGFDGSVIVLNDELRLGPDFQDYISENWSALAQEANVDRIALVSDHVTAMAVKANIDLSGAEIQANSTVEEAVDWVRQ